MGGVRPREPTSSGERTTLGVREVLPHGRVKEVASHGARTMVTSTTVTKVLARINRRTSPSLRTVKSRTRSDHRSITTTAPVLTSGQ